jgi:hypothetical protein
MGTRPHCQYKGEVQAESGAKKETAIVLVLHVKQVRVPAPAHEEHPEYAEYAETGWMGIIA